jgi:hypothetical protein
MKLELARAMLYNADLLLLDEVRFDSVILASAHQGRNCSLPTMFVAELSPSHRVSDFSQ